ncbi:BTG-domain-containing protein, partial [Hesseltinella vesiculosa]
MHLEIAQALDFLSRLLQSKIDDDRLASFKEKLAELLKLKYTNHWDPQQPFKGNGYRSISNFNQQLDPILIQAASKSDVSVQSLVTHLPRDFIIWIDPYSVSYRMGDHGNIMTLFEDRTRGRITFKLDPTNGHQPTGQPSPNSSPLMQYLQPRTTTPIRMSPPSSP